MPLAPPRRIKATLVVATALHVALLFLLNKVPLEHSGQDTQAPNVSASEIELVIEAVPNASPTAEREVPASPAGDSAPSAPAAQRAQKSARRSAEPEGEPAPPGDRGASGEDATVREDVAGERVIDPSAPTTGQPKVDLAIEQGAWSRYVNPLGTADGAGDSPSPRPGNAPPASTTGGLAEAIEARDQELGLGPGGRVLSAAHEAAHSEKAPRLGTATFVVTVLATGVVDVELTGANSDHAGWQEVASVMQRQIAQKPPNVRPPRKGARINLELQAVERWPNGAPVKPEGLAVSVSGSIQSTDQAKESLARRNPVALPPPGSPAEKPTLAANVDLPGVWVGARGKVCGFRVGMTLLGPMLQGGCDPSNIGAMPQRIVSARITRESMF